jgi:hypothetical protein
MVNKSGTGVVYILVLVLGPEVQSVLSACQNGWKRM